MAAPSLPPASGQSRVIRLFVSSTFRDMQPERDVLIKHTFPQLRRLCDQREYRNPRGSRGGCRWKCIYRR